jgi:hypothetical protein
MVWRCAHGPPQFRNIEVFDGTLAHHADTVSHSRKPPAIHLTPPVQNRFERVERHDFANKHGMGWQLDRLDDFAFKVHRAFRHKRR